MWFGSLLYYSVYSKLVVHAFLSILVALKLNNLYGISGLLCINEEDKSPFQVKYVTSKYVYFSYIFLVLSAISFIINTKTIYSPWRKTYNLILEVPLLSFLSSLKNSDFDFLNRITVILFNDLYLFFEG